MPIKTSLGLPIPHLTTPCSGTGYIAVTFPESVAQRNARKNGCKIFSVQLASILMSCIRISPPDSGEHRVILPFNPVNLRPRLSTIGPAEIVSATGFNVLEAAGLHRFVTCTGDEATLEAVWTIAKRFRRKWWSRTSGMMMPHELPPLSRRRWPKASSCVRRGWKVHCTMPTNLILFLQSLVSAAHIRHYQLRRR
jgi:hypothetical protein